MKTYFEQKRFTVSTKGQPPPVGVDFQFLIGGGQFGVPALLFNGIEVKPTRISNTKADKGARFFYDLPAVEPGSRATMVCSVDDFNTESNLTPLTMQLRTVGGAALPIAQSGGNVADDGIVEFSHAQKSFKHGDRVVFDIFLRFS
ncbi:MAG: hypothetical protein IAE82_16345 [Opitutaceae bacterium]|nr:hypothetical protein [Opitutaceae bacterium]